MKIGTRVNLMMSLLIVLMVAGTSAVVFVAEKRTLTHEITERQAAQVKNLRQVAQEYQTLKDDIFLLNFMKLLRKTEGVNYGMVFTSEGQVVGHTDIALIGSKTMPPAGSQIPAPDQIRRDISIDAAGRPSVEMTAAGPEIFARIGFSKIWMDQQVGTALALHRRRLLLVTAAALLVGLILTAGFSRTISGPIQRLAEATSIIGKGKLDHKIDIKSADELGTLAQDFNNMAEQLKELDQMKRDFVSSVTHELRSPLHSTRLYLGLFFKGGAGELTDKQKEYLKVIESNTLRLTRFIDDLLDLAKLERGKLEVQKQEFTLNEVLKDMKAMFLPHSDQKKIKFDVPDAETLSPVMGDAERTRQILINLLSNAFKFTPEGGTIAIDAQRENGHVKVSVQDTGLGIPKDSLEKIFEKFEQVKGVRNKLMGQQKGTGLGLAIVRALVEAQGGKIWVESEPNKGSRFIFTIPAKGN